ncbi:MAG: helix-turn-helix transcriptional regulator [Candidatus Borkfalkia sp.]
MATEFNPNYAIHPGILLLEEIEALNMTQKEVAEKIGVSKTIINEVIKGYGINAELAVRLESALKALRVFG